MRAKIDVGAPSFAGSESALFVARKCKLHQSTNKAALKPKLD